MALVVGSYFAEEEFPRELYEQIKARIEPDLTDEEKEEQLFQLAYIAGQVSDQYFVFDGGHTRISIDLLDRFSTSELYHLRQFIRTVARRTEPATDEGEIWVKEEVLTQLMEGINK